MDLRGIAATADIGRLTGCRLLGLIVIMGYCGDRGYWAVDRMFIFCIRLGDWGFISGMGFPTLIIVVIQFCYTMILVTEILYSCGSLPSSATPECATIPGRCRSVIVSLSSLFHRCYVLAGIPDDGDRITSALCVGWHARW